MRNLQTVVWFSACTIIGLALWAGIEKAEAADTGNPNYTSWTTGWFLPQAAAFVKVEKASAESPLEWDDWTAEQYLSFVSTIKGMVLMASSTPENGVCFPSGITYKGHASVVAHEILRTKAWVRMFSQGGTNPPLAKLQESLATVALEVWRKEYPCKQAPEPIAE